MTTRTAALSLVVWSLATLTALAPATGADKESRIFDVVRDFGAVADGKTDCARAIQSAIDAAIEAGGGRVSLPAAPAPYVVSKELRVHGSAVVVDGSGATLKLADGAGSAATVDVLEISGSPSSPVVDVVIRGLAIDANHFAQVAARRPRGIRIRHARDVLIDRVLVRRAWVGITFAGGATACKARDCLVTRWHNDGFNASGDGVSGGCRDIEFLRCHAFDALDATDGGDPGQRDNAWEIEDGARRVRLLDCTVNRAGGDAFAVRSHPASESTTEDIAFVRCQARDVAGRGWWIRGLDTDVRTRRIRLVDCVSVAPVVVTHGADDVEILRSRIEGSLILGRPSLDDRREVAAAAGVWPTRSVRVADSSLRELAVDTRDGHDPRRYTPVIDLEKLCMESAADILGAADGIRRSDVRIAPLGPLPAPLRTNYHTPPARAAKRHELQAGFPLVSPLVLDSGLSVTSRNEWFELRRPELIAHWRRILGKLGPNRSDARWFPRPVAARAGKIEELDGYSRQHVDIAIESDFFQPHILLTPRGQGQGPFPVVIAWTSTSPDYAEPERWWGAWLARHGHVVLCGWSFIRNYRDGTTYSTKAHERVYQRFGRWLPMAKMADDVRRGIAYLAQNPIADTDRVGFIGFSLSAKAALYVGAFVPEVSAIVSVDPHIALQGNTNYDAPWYLDSRRLFDDISTPRYPDPELRGTVESLLDASPRRPGLERNHHELLALCAPRALLLIGCSMEREGGATHSDDRQSHAYFNRAKEVYALLGIPERLELAPIDGGHRASSPEIDRAWQGFFERWLVKTPIRRHVPGTSPGNGR